MKRFGLLLTMMALLLAVAVGCSGASTPPEPTAAIPAEPEDTAAPTNEPTSVPPAATPPPAGTATAEPSATVELTPTVLPSATAPSATAPSATAEPTAEPTATTGPTATSAAESPAPGGRAAVSIEDFQFAPDNLTVSAGTTVVWTHIGEIRHTVTADDGSFDSPTLTGGDSFEFTFTTPGTYGYYCRFHGGTGHSGMSGFIVVTE